MTKIVTMPLMSACEEQDRSDQSKFNQYPTKNKTRKYLYMQFNFLNQSEYLYFTLNDLIKIFDDCDISIGVFGNKQVVMFINTQTERI